MDTKPPDTSGSGFGQQVDMWVGGGLCVLLAIDCMHLAGSHIITCDVMH